MLKRREFFRRAAVAATLLGVPMARAERVFAESGADPFSDRAEPLPPHDLLTTDPAHYWALLRRQWLLATDHVDLNCGSVGCSPLPVLRAMIDHVLSAEEFREPPYPWFGYEENTRLHEVREAVASYLHCATDELALVRNATEANNIVVNGLNLSSGDEVLLTDQEHPGGRCPWDQRVARHGVKINVVEIPKPPASAEEIVERFQKALTPKTKIIFFSHITTSTGLIMPAKQICAVARAKGILSHVDGAHAIGQIPLDMHDIGADFYGTSPHKWLMAPKGTGTLYIREERMKDLWVNIATANWNNYDLKAYRFSWFGTSNLSVMVGLKAALEFHRAVGPEIVFARIHELAKQVRDKVAAYPQLRITNASADQFYGGMVSFDLVKEKAKGDLKKVVDGCAARNIRIVGGPDHFRVSTHIFTQPTELDLFYDALSEGLA
jgi:selenocysteine lyase/cysteine desulfurase